MIRRLKGLTLGRTRKQPALVEARAVSRPASVAEARKLLASEIRLLMKEAKALSNALGAELKVLASELDSVPDKQLLGQLSRIDQSLMRVRQGLQRLALTRWETPRLMDEWHEWKRLTQASAGRHPEASVREELVASELLARGIRLPETRGSNNELQITNSESQTIQPATRSPQPVALEAEPVKVEATGYRLQDDDESDWLGEWQDKYQRMVEAEFAYWNDLMAVTEKLPYMDPETSLALYKGSRRAHGAHRLLRRKRVL